VTIQILLLLAVVGALFYFVRSQNGVRIRAGKRLGFVLFLLANVYAVLRPDDVTWVAHRVGVGRGADLVLYLTVVSFVFAVLNFYQRSKDTERRLTDLARAVALRDAEIANRHKFPSDPDSAEAMMAAVVAEGDRPGVTPGTRADVPEPAATYE
jgi:hypothetical protein